MCGGSCLRRSGSRPSGCLARHPTAAAAAAGVANGRGILLEGLQRGFRVRILPVGPLACNCIIVAACCSGFEGVRSHGRATGATSVAGPIARCCSRPGIIVDPGGDSSAILEAVKADGITVGAIVITHGHLDHFLSAGVLSRALGNCPIRLHDADAWLWQAWRAQCVMMGVSPAGLAEDHLPDEPTGAGLEHGQVVAVACDVATASPCASGGNRVQVRATVLHTPGHTPGSVCLWFPALNLLCTGDTLFFGSIGRTDLPGGDSVAIVSSIRNRLLPLLEFPAAGAKATPLMHTAVSAKAGSVDQETDDDAAKEEHGLGGAGDRGAKAVLKTSDTGCWDTALLPRHIDVVPGHGPLTTLLRERDHNPFLVHARL